MIDWSEQRSDTERMLDWGRYPVETKQYGQGREELKDGVNVAATGAVSTAGVQFTTVNTGMVSGVAPTGLTVAGLSGAVTAPYTAPPAVTPEWLAQAQKVHHAYTFLQKAVDAMKDRAAVRDVQNASNPAKQGERSMKATVAAFNGLTGRDLTEEEGWEFMILLKMVRGRQGDFRDDDYIDGAAYFGLLGECASKSR